MTASPRRFVHQHTPARSPEAPVLLALHGTGGDERQLLGLARLLAPDAAVIAPRGPVVEGDGMPRFFRRIPTGDGSAYPYTFDEEEVVERAGQLAEFVRGALSEYDLAGRLVVAFGFSNGANIAGVLHFLHPGLLRGGLLAAPMPILEVPPAADLSSVAVMLAGGRHDPIATPEGVEALRAALGERGASASIHWHDGGHDLPRSVLDAGRYWLDQLRRATATDPLA